MPNEQLQLKEVPHIMQSGLPYLIPQREWKHATLNRNLSAPVHRSPPPVRVPFMREKSSDYAGQQCSSSTDFHQLAFPVTQQMISPSFESTNDAFLPGNTTVCIGTDSTFKCNALEEITFCI